jgi:hypothetical protein
MSHYDEEGDTKTVSVSRETLETLLLTAEDFRQAMQAAQRAGKDFDYGAFQAINSAIAEAQQTLGKGRR